MRRADGPAVRAAPRRPLHREPRVLMLASVLVLLAGWQVAALLAGPLLLATPLATAAALVSGVASGELLSAAGETARVFLLGFAAAAVLGVLVGLAAGYVQTVGALLDVTFDVFIALPVVALIPLLVSWQGLTTTTQLIVVFLAGFFPVAVNAQVGARSVGRTLRAVGSVFAAGRLHRFVAIVVPAAVPSIAAGLRIGVGRAVVGVFVAELFTGSTGLGARMQYYSTYFQTDRYFAGMAVLVAVALAATVLCARLTRRWTGTPREGDRHDG